MDELDYSYLISSERFKSRVYDGKMREAGKRLRKQEYLIVDATFYRKRWRDRLREVAADEERVVTIFIECSLETCLLRNRERETPLPEKAIQVIWKEFERLDDHDIYINTEKYGVEKAVEKILKKIKTPESNSRAN